MLSVQIPSNTKKLQQQIAGLEYLIKHDNSKDKAIHMAALEKLKGGLCNERKN